MVQLLIPQLRAYFHSKSFRHHQKSYRYRVDRWMFSLSFVWVESGWNDRWERFSLCLVTVSECVISLPCGWNFRTRVLTYFSREPFPLWEVSAYCVASSLGALCSIQDLRSLTPFHKIVQKENTTLLNTHVLLLEQAVAWFPNVQFLKSIFQSHFKKRRNIWQLRCSFQSGRVANTTVVWGTLDFLTSP